MGRWLAVAAIVCTFTVMMTGWLHWEGRMDNVQYTVDRDMHAEEKTRTEATQKKQREKPSVEHSLSINDILLPFDEKYQQLTSHYQQEMETYVKEAKGSYQQAILEGKSSHHEIVDTYRKKADELEDQVEGQFQRKLEEVNKELEKHGYDASYTWEYEWALESLMESTRLEYVRTLIELETNVYQG